MRLAKSFSRLSADVSQQRRLLRARLRDLVPGRPGERRESDDDSDERRQAAVDDRHPSRLLRSGVVRNRRSRRRHLERRKSGK